MSRESNERKAMFSGIDDSPRGAGDPDFYGYPGEPVVTVEMKPLADEIDLDNVPF